MFEQIWILFILQTENEQEQSIQLRPIVYLQWFIALAQYGVVQIHIAVPEWIMPLLFFLRNKRCNPPSYETIRLGSFLLYNDLHLGIFTGLIL